MLYISMSLVLQFVLGFIVIQAKLQHLINVVHSVEKIEKILFAEPGSTDMEIYMEGSRCVFNT